jgi:hypothetical protein
MKKYFSKKMTVAILYPLFLVINEYMGNPFTDDQLMYVAGVFAVYILAQFGIDRVKESNRAPEGSKECCVSVSPPNVTVASTPKEINFSGKSFSLNSTYDVSQLKKDIDQIALEQLDMREQRDKANAAIKELISQCDNCAYKEGHPDSKGIIISEEFAHFTTPCVCCGGSGCDHCNTSGNTQE